MLVWEWISNLISLLTGHVIMYPCWNYSYKFSCTYVRSNYCSLSWNISSHYIVNSSNISVLDYGFEPNRRQAVITCAAMSRKELMSAGLGLGWQIAWTMSKWRIGVVEQTRVDYFVSGMWPETYDYDTKSNTNLPAIDILQHPLTHSLICDRVWVFALYNGIRASRAREPQSGNFIFDQISK